MQVCVLNFATTDALGWELQWNWLLPSWATMLLVLTMGAWIVTLYANESAPIGRLRRTCLAILRLAALSIVLLMIAQPTLNWFRQDRTAIVVLVDRSASMATEDVTTSDEPSSRLKWSQQKLQEWLSEWQDLHSSRIMTFAADVALAESVELNEIEVAPVQEGTQLGEAIDFALSRASLQTPAAVVLFSDGRNTQGKSLPEAGAKARRLQVPLFSVAVGSDRPLPDLALENLIAEDSAFPGDFLQLKVTLTARSMQGQRALVTLQDRSTETELAKTEISIADDEMQKTVRLGCRVSVPGVLQLQLNVSTDLEEKNIANNSLQHSVNVSDDKIQVLLIDSAPSYEYRSLASLLSRDPAVALRTWLQEADPDFAEVERAALRSLPTTESELLEFDVVILGDVDPGPLPPAFWSGLQAVVTEHGRGLVATAGHRFMPHAHRNNEALKTLLPINLPKQPVSPPDIDPLASFSLAPTTIGRNLGMMQLAQSTEDSQTTWQKLPPITWLSPIAAKKPGAHVLAEARGTMQAAGEVEFVIVRHYAGAGEVLYHATDETWRWKLQSDDRLFARYWGQVVRRLGRSRLAAQTDGILLTSDRQQYRARQSVRLHAHFHNSALAPAEADGVAVELVGETQPRREIRLTRQLGYRGEFGYTLRDLPADRYKAKIISPLTEGIPSLATFEIKAPPGEMTNTTVHIEALEQLSAMTGSKVYTTETAGELSADLPPPRNVRIESLKDEPLWNSHWAIALLLAVLTTEWILRRRAAML